MKAINIAWDVTEEERELGIELPTEMDVPKKIQGDIDSISDYLSNETGFCHHGFGLVDSAREIIVPVTNGRIIARATGGDDYPGIIIEFEPDSNQGSNVAVLVECPRETGRLRALLWDNEEDEEPSAKITLCDTTGYKR